MLKLLFIMVFMPSIAWPAYPDPVGSFCITQFGALDDMESHTLYPSEGLWEVMQKVKLRAGLDPLLQSQASAYEKKLAEMKTIELEILHFSFFRGYYIDTIQTLCSQAALINAELTQQKLALNHELSKAAIQKR